jgi:hypothetical protein
MRGEYGRLCARVQCVIVDMGFGGGECGRVCAWCAKVKASENELVRMPVMG